MNVRTEPEIPQNEKNSHPDVKVFNGKELFCGDLLYDDYVGPCGPGLGYLFHAVTTNGYTSETLRQIADKIDEADAAVKAGLL